MKLQDAVVTMLGQISTAALDSFLERASLRLIQSFKDPRKTDKLVITKKNNKVMVGIFDPHVLKRDGRFEFKFDNLVRFTVAQAGSWDITSMSSHDRFRANWEHVWAGQTVDSGDGEVDRKATPTSHSKGCWDLVAFQLADNIMTNRLWDAETSAFSIGYV